MTWAIETFALTKYFPRAGGGASSDNGRRGRAAVDRVTLAIKQGELFGLLGPNGAGKTTFIKMLATLVVPSSGRGVVNGFDLSDDQAVRQSISLVSSDERSFYWRLTGRQNLEFFASLYHVPGNETGSRVTDLLKTMGIEGAAEMPVKEYSSGMKQRLSIARALLARRQVLFMDEPTRGLDPPATRELHRLISEELVAGRGITVVLATHHLWEAELLCHRIGVMHRGRLQGCGSPAELRNSLGLREHWRLVTGAPASLFENSFDAFPDRFSIASETGAGCTITWPAEPGHGAEGVVETVLREGGSILGLSREEASLETIFDALTRERDTAGLGPADCVRTGDDAGRQPSGVAKRRSRFKRAAENLRSLPRLAAVFIKRDCIEEWSYRLSFAIQLISILFSVLMFYFLSKLLDRTVSPYLASYGGADYFSFVLLGLAFTRYFDVGLSTFSNSLRDAQTTGTLEAMLTSPAGISVIIASSSLWNYLFTSLQVVVYLLIGTLLLGARFAGFSVPALVVIIVLTIVCFSSLGIIAAGFIMVYKRGDPVVWFFSTLSTLLSGVYYPVAILPDWVRPFSRLLPTTYVMDAVRLCFLQGCSIWEIRRELAGLAGFCLVLVPLSLWLFHLAVHRAKVHGSLSHY